MLPSVQDFLLTAIDVLVTIMCYFLFIFYIYIYVLTGDPISFYNSADWVGEDHSGHSCEAGRREGAEREVLQEARRQGWSVPWPQLLPWHGAQHPAAERIHLLPEALRSRRLLPQGSLVSYCYSEQSSLHEKRNIIKTRIPAHSLEPQQLLPQTKLQTYLETIRC